MEPDYAGTGTEPLSWLGSSIVESIANGSDWPGTTATQLGLWIELCCVLSFEVNHVIGEVADSTVTVDACADTVWPLRVDRERGLAVLSYGPPPAAYQ